MRDSKVDKWRAWLSEHGKVRDEVLNLHLRRYVWQEIMRMLREYGDRLPDSYWWRFMVDNYIACQAIAVRRQADTDSRVITLGRLLTEINKDAERITRPVLAAIWKPDDPLDERDLDAKFSEFSGGCRHFDSAIAQADLEALRDGAAKVSSYADRHLAHLDATPLPVEQLPSVDDLHAAIGVIGDLFRRYQLLLTAADMPSLVPILQPDWMAPFRQSWIPPGERFFPRHEWHS
jgi:hypothetical protein